MVNGYCPDDVAGKTWRRGTVQIDGSSKEGEGRSVDVPISGRP